MDAAEYYVWEILYKMGISEETSDTGTVENILESVEGITLADFRKGGKVTRRMVTENIAWL